MLTICVPVRRILHNITVKMCTFLNHDLTVSAHAWTQSVLTLLVSNKCELIWFHFPIWFFSHHYLSFIYYKLIDIITYHTWSTKYPGIQTARFCQNHNILQRDKTHETRKSFTETKWIIRPTCILFLLWNQMRRQCPHSFKRKFMSQLHFKCKHEDLSHKPIISSAPIYITLEYTVRLCNKNYLKWQLFDVFFVLFCFLAHDPSECGNTPANRSQSLPSSSPPRLPWRSQGLSCRSGGSSTVRLWCWLWTVSGL